MTLARTCLRVAALTLPGLMALIPGATRAEIKVPGAPSYLTTAHDILRRGKPRFASTDLPLLPRVHLAFRKYASEPVKRVLEAAQQVGKQ